MCRKIIEKSFDIDYPDDVNNPFVGSLYDVYEKAYKRALGFNDKKIDSLTDTEIEQLSATWALELNRPNTYYKVFLKEVKSGKRNLETLPYFIVKIINKLGYDVS